MRRGLLTLLLAALSVWTAVWFLPDNHLHVVFCDVGQGDAILITYKTTQMLVDTGPDDSILSCLSQHIPFYDHTLEMVMLTHPQQDHMGGTADVLQRYSVEQLVIPPVENPIRVYKQLIQDYTDGKIAITNIYSQDVLQLGPEVKFTTIWPTRTFIASHAQPSSQVLGWATDGTDLNSFGIVGILSFGEFDLLLTADADQKVQLAEIQTGLIRPVEVLKVPHHGSKTGMMAEWLDLVQPELAVISVGKNNRYDHPRAEALQLLEEIGAQVLRTDLNGSIELISDGQAWWVK